MPINGNPRPRLSLYPHPDFTFRPELPVTRSSSPHQGARRPNERQIRASSPKPANSHGSGSPACSLRHQNASKRSSTFHNHVVREPARLQANLRPSRSIVRHEQTCAMLLRRSSRVGICHLNLAAMTLRSTTGVSIERLRSARGCRVRTRLRW